jgi:nicotinate phosphoribosyltransferase
MRAGRVVPGSLPPLSEIWELAQANLRALPERFRDLKVPDAYPVRFSDAVRALRTHAIADQLGANQSKQGESAHAPKPVAGKTPQVKGRS